MLKTNDKNDLGYLGEDFQYRLVHVFVEDKEFFKDLSSVIDQNMFTNPRLKMYVGVLKETYDTMGSVPSYRGMETLLLDKSKSESDRQFILEVSKKIESLEVEDAELIKNAAMKFFKQQNIIKTANEILRIAGDGDHKQYDRCVELLQEALSKGVHDNLGCSVFDNLAETLSNDYRTPIPTGVEKLDESLEGGLGKGELGVIIGSSSFGKTSLTTAMASHAATYKCEQNNFQGFKVLQIVFEDRIKQIQRKHLGRITGVEARDLSKDEYKQVVEERLQAFQDKELLNKNLRIVRFPSGEYTAQQLYRYIKKLIANGFKPDLCIIDYFECLAHVGDASTSNEYEKEGKTMRKLEAIAGELDMAIWVPTQGTKESVNLELVTMDKAGGSFKKIQIAHIVMSIARTMEDIEANKATIALLKNRAGKSGKVFNNVEFNNGTCRINTDSCDAFENMIAYNNNSDKVKRETMDAIISGMKKRK